MNTTLTRDQARETITVDGLVNGKHITFIKLVERLVKTTVAQNAYKLTVDANELWNAIFVWSRTNQATIVDYMKRTDPKYQNLLYGRIARDAVNPVLRAMRNPIRVPVTTVPDEPSPSEEGSKGYLWGDRPTKERFTATDSLLADDPDALGFHVQVIPVEFARKPEGGYVGRLHKDMLNMDEAEMAEAYGLSPYEAELIAAYRQSIIVGDDLSFVYDAFPDKKPAAIRKALSRAKAKIQPNMEQAA